LRKLSIAKSANYLASNAINLKLLSGSYLHPLI